MTELLQRAFAEISKLPDEQQDEIATRLLTELEDEQVVHVTSIAIPVETETPLQKFQRLSNAWKEETQHISVASDMILHPAYQQIIAMGTKAVPFMLEDMKQNLTHWFWALYVITGVNPVKPEDEGRIRKMTEAWLQWGKDHGYVHEQLS